MFELRKIGFVKRASALLLDAILLVVLTTGFMFIISLICKYDHEQDLLISYQEQWSDYHKNYAQGVSEAYGFTYKITDEEKQTFTVTDKDGNRVTLDDVWKKLSEADGAGNEVTVKAWEDFQVLKDGAPLDRQYSYVLNLMFMMLSVGTALSYMVLEFIIPIIMKNGQTVGKKVFGIGLVRPDCVKITIPQLFARTFIGKYAIETMFPILLIILFFFGSLGIMAIILFAAVTILNIAVFFASKNRTPIHDVLAHTVVIDFKLQVVFQSTEEMMERKTLQHTEMVENSKS